jgi:alkanesulfonate monooxygenase SsuD/methylene tetrahydromethanopterin reductase-like flavin-dependent oxidoreductase (luciferase family)
MSGTALMLAIEVDGDGAHPAAWRRAQHRPTELLTPERVRDVAQIAERAGFTLATLDDDLLPPGRHPHPAGRIGSVERAAYIAAATSVLSVAPIVSTTYTEPFHVSSQLASLDHISAGRTGWVVTASPDPEAARAWGRAPVSGTAELRREATDSVRVVRRLWDSWEDDAVIRDVASSRFLNRDRLHYVDFVGDTYSVKGPAIVPRPPQGQLVVFAEPGLLPADQVDVTLLNSPNVGALRSAAAASGAACNVADIEVALDTPTESAAARLAELQREAPWPDRGRLRYVGDPAGLVSLLNDLAQFLDGVRIHPLVLDEDLPVLSRLVVPALILARTARRPLPASSLRATLGLARPENHFAASGSEGTGR